MPSSALCLSLAFVLLIDCCSCDDNAEKEIVSAIYLDTIRMYIAKIEKNTDVTVGPALLSQSQTCDSSTGCAGISVSNVYANSVQLNRASLSSQVNFKVDSLTYYEENGVEYDRIKGRLQVKLPILKLNTIENKRK